MNYIIKVNLALIGFYLLYRLLFAKETFFQINRIYLLGAIVFSVVFPFLTIDTSLVADYTYQLPTIVVGGSGVGNEVISNSELTTGAVLKIIYFTGVAIFLMSFLWSFSRLMLLYKNTKPIHKYSGYRIFQGNNVISSFSFFNLIYLNAEDEKHRKEVVLRHELVHVRQWHSIDILLLEILKIVFWFNPIVHLYLLSMRAVHEYIADKRTAKIEQSQTTYSKILLGQVFGVTAPVLSNSLFNHKLLKQRIMMLNKSKSTQKALVKYLLVLPVALVFILANNPAKVEAIVTFDTPEPERQEINVPPVPEMPLAEVSESIESAKVPQPTPREAEEKKAIKATPLNIDTIPPIPPPPPPPPPPYTKDGIYRVVSDMPRFPGCEDKATKEEKNQCAQKKMLMYIYKNIHYPEKARKEGTQGTVVISFVVQTDGTITRARIARDVGGGLAQEALRVVNTMPKWIPGKEKGEVVPVQFNLPVRFKLDPEESKEKVGEEKK